MKQIALILTMVVSNASLSAAEKTTQGEKARAAVIRAYDADKDGKLDDAERATILEAFDANKDGKLDARHEKFTPPIPTPPQWYCLTAPRIHAVETKPNDVLILADDLGYGEPDCYGGPKAKTPNTGRRRGAMH